MSDDQTKPVETPVSFYPHTKARDDMDDANWHRVRDEEEQELKKRRAGNL